MLWVYLAPHLDDVVYSCGGLVFEQTRGGEQVWVLTVCAGDPPPGALTPFAEALHQRWGVSARRVAAVRRAEDQAACALLGAKAFHWEVPDAIYRRTAQGEPLYPDGEALFGALHPADAALVTTLAERLQRWLPAQARLVVPLAIGRHVDHQLVRQAAERSGRVTYYYADFPYAAREEGALARVRAERRLAVPPPGSEEALHAWLEGIRTYASQFSTFWADEQALEAEVRAFLALGGGALWR